jgi:hypothetical protein
MEQLDHTAVDRNRMVERQVAARGVRDPRVLEAMHQVPREVFVAPGFEEFTRTARCRSRTGRRSRSPISSRLSRGLASELNKARVPHAHYRVATLDGFAIRLIRLFPKRSGHDPAILELGRRYRIHRRRRPQ